MTRSPSTMAAAESFSHEVYKWFKELFAFVLFIVLGEHRMGSLEHIQLTIWYPYARCVPIFRRSVRAPRRRV